MDHRPRMFCTGYSSSTTQIRSMARALSEKARLRSSWAISSSSSGGPPVTGRAFRWAVFCSVRWGLASSVRMSATEYEWRALAAGEGEGEGEEVNRADEVGGGGGGVGLFKRPPASERKAVNSAWAEERRSGVRGTWSTGEDMRLDSWQRGRVGACGQNQDRQLQLQLQRRDSGLPWVRCSSWARTGAWAGLRAPICVCGRLFRRVAWHGGGIGGGALDVRPQVTARTSWNKLFKPATPIGCVVALPSALPL